MSDYSEHLISMAGGDGDADVLGEIEARATSAHPAPWKAWDRGIGYEIHTWLDEPLNAGHRETFNIADANFIAHARTDIPALLAMVREQRAVLERVEAVLTAIETHASLDSSPVEYRTVGGWVDVEDALTAALTATEAS